jgi:hypothetical protein
MRSRLESAVTIGKLQPDWDFEEHWHEVERALGGRGRHWIDQGDLEGKAEGLGIDYDQVRTVSELIRLLEKIGNHYTFQRK